MTDATKHRRPRVDTVNTVWKSVTNGSCLAIQRRRGQDYGTGKPQLWYSISETEYAARTVSGLSTSRLIEAADSSSLQRVTKGLLTIYVRRDDNAAEVWPKIASYYRYTAARQDIYPVCGSKNIERLTWAICQNCNTEWDEE